MDRTAEHRTVEDLLREHGTTLAEEAGITLRDKPMPLFQLAVLSLLASTRIRAEVATRAARELWSAGWRTPARLQGSTWQQRVDALGRGGYRRYDESTATALGEAAAHVQDAYAGDLRRLRPRDLEGGVEELHARLQELPRIGPTGASIFCREVQAVWPEVRPFLDDRARGAAADLGLPRSAEQLGRLVPSQDLVRLAAALERAGRRG